MGEAATLSFFELCVTHTYTQPECNWVDQNVVEVTLTFLQCMLMSFWLVWIEYLQLILHTVHHPSEQFKMIVKQSLVSMVESVLICSGVSTVTVLGLDTLETFVKSEVCISMTNLLPSSHSQYLTMHSWHGAQWNKACDPSFTCQHNKVFICNSKPDLCCRWLPPTTV